MNKIEEIENLIWDTWDKDGITEEQYIEFEKTIRSEDITENSNQVRLLAELHINHSNNVLRKASNMCLEAMEMYPEDVGVCDHYNISAKGFEVDFKKRNRMDVINELYACYAMYDKAIPLYWKSFAMQEKPRWIDGLISVSQIYQIIGDKNSYLKAVSEIIKVYKEDYNLTDGIEVASWKSKISLNTSIN